MKNFTKSVVAMVVALCSATQAMAQLPEGFVPLGATNTEVKTVKNGSQYDVVVSFDLSDKMVDWNYNSETMEAEVDSIVLIRFTEDEMMSGVSTSVKTILNPVKGNHYEMTDENVPYGEYYYQPVTYVGGVTDDGYPAVVLVGEAPGYFECSAALVPGSHYNVAIDIQLPSTNSDGDLLGMPITKVVVSELADFGEPIIIGQEDAAEVLEPGTTFQYIVENVAEGSHTYMVEVFTAASSSSNMANIFVGTDRPGMVESLMAVKTAEGVVISWEAPTSGKDGGDYGDSADLTYTVWRSFNPNDESGATKLIEGLKALTYTDTYQPTEEGVFYYIVMATNSVGNGYTAGTFEPVVMGPAALLPFAEGFDGKVSSEVADFDHSTWTRTNVGGFFCTWNVGTSAYLTEEIAPHSGTGLVYAMYSGWGYYEQQDRLISGHINFSAASAPCVSFWLYDLAGYNGNVKLSIEVSVADGEPQVVQNYTVGQADAEGWRQIVCELPAVKGAASAQVIFCSEATGADCYPVIIDEISILADVASVQNIESKDNSVKAVYNLQGLRVEAAKSGMFISNGKKFFVK